MLKRFSRILVVLALASSIGMHWALFQAVAWAGMIVSYSQQAPLGQAVIKTFDGLHPCSLCKQIAQGKHSEKKSEYKFEVSKLTFAYAPSAFVFRAPTSFWEADAGDHGADSRTLAPPFPPPRAFFV